MQLSNYHSHCTFCDGRSTPEDFIKFAVAHGFRAYGFSSHSPLPFETFWNMSKDDMPEYLTEIERLKKKYSDRLEIYVGLEIDFLDESNNDSFLIHINPHFCARFVILSCIAHNRLVPSAQSHKSCK